ERFSTAALRVLAEEVCVQQHLLVMSFGAAIERRHGTEDAVAVVDRQFTGIAGLTSQRLRDAFAAGDGSRSGTTLADVAQVLDLHPAFRPRAYVDWRVTLADDHVGLVLGDCPARHERGMETWISRLADGHDDGLAAAVEGVTPYARLERTGPSRWSVTMADEPAPDRSEVALTRFSTGATFVFIRYRGAQ
ncbi:MAG: hypothetical protein IT194_12525, partial [Microthrixaceae bacterium]|nr:hypothetical protein [Microthrixaceae bacterium]